VFPEAMNVPSVFAAIGLGKITRFVDEHPLATVVLVADGQPYVDLIPSMRASGPTASG